MNGIKLIKNIRPYNAPDGKTSDLLLAGGKILAAGPGLDAGNLPAEVIDGQGALATPGFIDLHLHTIGGGGQTGFFSLAPEVKVSSLVSCGTTTVVGMLGTDSFVKGLPQLYARTMALRQNGLSAYMLTGAYSLPTPTITGTIADDLIFIDPVIGCKIAISDDRSSFPTELELLRIIHDVRLGGFTSGKGGVMHIHLGALESGMDVLVDIARKYPSLIGYISPTHTIRTEKLFAQAIDFALMGGMIDISTGGTKYTDPYKAVLHALEQGVGIGSMTFSSDGNAGVRRIDPEKGIDTYRLAPLDLNFAQTVKLVTEGGLKPSEAFKLITENPAKVMKLRNKGMLLPGYDADVCLLGDDYSLQTVISGGEVFVSQGKIVKYGNFE